MEEFSSVHEAMQNDEFRNGVLVELMQQIVRINEIKRAHRLLNNTTFTDLTPESLADIVMGMEHFPEFVDLHLDMLRMISVVIDNKSVLDVIDDLIRNGIVE
jgi:hypothetical protein